MTHLIQLAIFFLVSTALATLALYDQGRLSLTWQGWVLETSFTFAVLILVLSFGALYLLVRLLMGLVHLPGTMRGRQRMKRYEKAETAMTKGLMALEYGDWRTAEQQLVRTAKQSESGLMHYLSAAKMAHSQIGKLKGAEKRCKEYLELARKQFPEEYLMVGLVEARMLSETEPETAILLLAEMHRLNPEHKPVFAELGHVLARHGYWEQLDQIWAELFNAKAIEKADLLEMEIQLRAGKLSLAKSVEQLEILWQNLHRKLQMQPTVLAAYVDKKLVWKDETHVASWIEKVVAKNWSDELVFQYGVLTQGTATDRLKKAENWLHKHPNNPVLLLTLGRLSCQAQVWGQAQQYFKKSLSIKPTVGSYHALAECLEAEGQEEQAALIYKQAILQLDGRSQEVKLLS